MTTFVLVPGACHGGCGGTTRWWRSYTGPGTVVSRSPCQDLELTNPRTRSRSTLMSRRSSPLSCKPTRTAWSLSATATEAP